MSLHVRRALLVGLAIAGAVFVAFKIAAGEMLVPELLAAGTILLLVAHLGWRVEAVVLAGTLFGYIVGNRGIAQFAPAAEIPVLMGELSLGFCAAVLLLRGALARHLPLRKDALNLSVLLWLALGAGRLFVDIRTFGFVAVRDAATVYYALYFFVAQEIAREERARWLLLRALEVGLLLLTPVFLLWVYFPYFFNTYLIVRGVPLIFYKGDIVATLLAGGVFYFYFRAEATRRNWAWGAMALNLAGALLPTTRAAMLGLVVVSALHGWARRWRFFFALASMVLVFAAISVGPAVFSNRPLHNTLAYRTVEYALSILDLRPAGGSYRSYDEGDVKGRPDDNNAFRLVWWKTVARETFAAAPVFGQGFGADLATSFLSNYGLAGQTDFSTRSPHSILFTTFGRMGFAGIATLAMVLIACAHRTLVVLRRDRATPGGGEELALWAMVWVIFLSACFGVVLEGPMGAIPFWTLLGLANRSATVEAREQTTAPLHAGTTGV